jgi:epoxyqueuosine reductase
VVKESPETRAARVKELARSLGFEACGIAEAGHVDPEDRFGQWIARGFHADMEWLVKTKALRQDARERLPTARSVVVVARAYCIDAPPAAAGSGRVARYAWGKDYHRALRAPIRQLVRGIDAMEPGTRACFSIDDKGVMERAWAERAGLGWVGKNSLILNRELGSWFVLGTIFTAVELAPDAPVDANCGTCRACLDACPTQAIVEEGVVDARRCISYHTIENPGEIPADIQSKMGNWLFGCDVCQEVCPWNRFAETPERPSWVPRPGIPNPPLAAVAGMDVAAFDAYFAGTPVRRASHAGMLRNVRIAIANSQPSE